MLTSLKMSLIKLETPFKTYGQYLTTKKNSNIYPISETFLKKHFPNLVNAYRKLKAEFFTPDDKIYHPKLRPYQNKDVSIMLKRPVNALFYEQRVGKTPTTIVTIANRPEIKQTIIVAPKSTHWHWKNAIEEWDPDKVITIINHPEEIRLKKYQDKSTNYYIITYETLAIDYNKIPKMDCIVLDELQKIRHFKGQRSKKTTKFTKYVLQYSYKIKYKFALSGTPTSNNSQEIFAILNFLYPKMFTSYWNFINYYYNVEQKTVYTKTEELNINNIIGIKKDKEKELQEFLEMISIMRKRKEVLNWMPKVSVETTKLELTEIQKRHYNQLLYDWECPELEYNCQTQLDWIIRLRQITSTYKNGVKENFIKDYIADNTNEPIIITSFFSSYLRTLQVILSKYKPILITGEDSAKQRQQKIDDFNNGKTKIILGNIDVIKEGISLQEAETLIVIDPSLTYTNNEQVYDRFLPTSEEKALTKNKNQIIKLIVKDTIDIYIEESLKEKKSSTEIVNNFKKKLTVS